MVFPWLNNNKLIDQQLLKIKEDLVEKMKCNVNQPMPPLQTWEQNIIDSIVNVTNTLNANNVTRTAAYLNFYIRHPDIHWALLGHMVSRNGGWHMTDLKGDLLTRLISEKEQKNYFLFLERGNWLIFQDVFPQFLLYHHSLRMKRNLFYLLPYLNVSTFMETIWNHYWENRNYYLLAIATVINEQNYLEKHVIQNHHFQKTVLNTIGFKLYDFLRFNHIIFPYVENETKPALIGATLQHFASLHERIMLGKRLYSLLFHQENVLQGVLRWAKKNKHTGSRADYWGHLFHHVKESLPGTIYKRRTKKCELKKGEPRIYSPQLKFAWGNIKHEDADSGDWFHDWKVIHYLKEETFSGGDIYEDYCKTIEKIELTIMAKKAIFLRKE
ncbi:MAG: DUF2515 domain-containing protein [Bacillaceae bacterium]|jgi:Protein of unknown function (DUF2515)|uniref:DUF2515 family protein n=1 Tax=Aeribacillus composti TaxID=1868734 RepID=UPI000E394043|nr:DUF2515 family protein [Aeribacillus composti]REJ14666.1 MAG: DUF2515 domain-containing protein [Bacillaceae bacterium]